MSISTVLLKAAKIQEQIEKLRGQLAELLSQAQAEINARPAGEVPALARRPSGPRKTAKSHATNGRVGRGRRTLEAVAADPAPEPAKAPRARGGRRRSPLAGRKRSSSPSGPLAPAVVEVLSGASKPMNVKDILDGLTSNGYVFSSPEPKKNLAARIYRLNGVKQVGPGMFGLA